MAKPVGWINFEIVGNDRGVQQMLNRVDSALSVTGLAAFLHGAVGPWVQERAADRFSNEGDDVSGKWAPLSEVTVDIREKSGFEGAHPINKRTGELEAYITQGSIGVVSSPGLAVMKYPDNPPRTAAIREKMKTAQKGRAHPATVARPVLGLNERDLAQVLTMLAFFIEKGGVAGAGGR